MSFSCLSKRAKKTKLNEQGKFKRKKRFGKSLGKKTPSMSWSVKVSQYNHKEDDYKKKKSK